MKPCVGYCGTTTAKVGILSLSGAEGNIVCNGVTYPVTMTGYGDDNPARPGVYAGYAGYAEIAGLSPFSRYSCTVTQGDESYSCSFITLPDSSEVDWSFTMSTCDAFVNAATGDPYYHIRRLAEEADPPMLFYAHIDDVQYYDAYYVLSADLDRESTGNPMATGLEWDYVLAHLNWHGVVPTYKRIATTTETVAPGVNTHRRWCRENLPLWVQWGDHEIEGDHCRRVANPPTSSFGCNRELEAVAESAWNGFLSDFCTPPKLREDEQYWGDRVGPVTFVAYDCNKHSIPYDCCDVGDTHSFGRSGTVFAGTCDGATNPTRTAMGIDTDAAPTDFLGETQVNDILDYLNDSNPFHILFASNGISRQNEPWAELWPDEWDDFCSRADTGIMQNPATDGTSGQLVFLKGDTHGREVNRYESNGMADVLGGVAAGKALWEINPGTISGSWSAAAMNPLYQNGVRRYVSDGNGTTGGVLFWSFLHVIVYGSRSPKEIEYRMIDGATGKVLWTGYQYEGQGDNEIHYRPRYIGI